MGGLASREAVGEKAGLRWDELVNAPRLGECADMVRMWQTLWVPPGCPLRVETLTPSG